MAQWWLACYNIFWEYTVVNLLCISSAFSSKKSQYHMALYWKGRVRFSSKTSLVIYLLQYFTSAQSKMYWLLSHSAKSFQAISFHLPWLTHDTDINCMSGHFLRSWWWQLPILRNKSILKTHYFVKSRVNFSTLPVYLRENIITLL